MLLIALLDTGVPRVGARRGVASTASSGSARAARASRSGAPRTLRLLPAGRLVVADASAALAILFGEVAPGHEPRARTRRLTLFAVQVAGVPTLYAEEALWSGRAALEQPVRTLTASGEPRHRPLVRW